MNWRNASVIIATVHGEGQHLLARCVGYYLGEPDGEWLIVGSGTVVPSVVLTDVEVALW